MLAEVLALPDLAQNPKLYSALSTHSAIFTSLAGKIVRSLPVLKNHRMKRAPGPGPCAKSFNCFVNFDLCSSLTATSEPSSENSSPLAIAESDSTCCAGELAIETEAPIFDFSPRRFFHLPSQLDGSSRIPEFSGLVPAYRQNSSTVWTKPCPGDRILMFKRCDQLARRRIPEFSRVPACASGFEHRQD